jgi:hypothetical protein
MNLDERTFTIVTSSEFFDIAKEDLDNVKTSVVGGHNIVCSTIDSGRKYLVVSNEIFEQMNIEG